jgi:hypothetical protein
VARWTPTSGTTAEQEPTLRIRIGTVTAAAVLFLAGAIGLLGGWSLGIAVVLLVATSVSTAIAMEEEREPSRVPVRTDGR